MKKGINAIAVGESKKEPTMNPAAISLSLRVFNKMNLLVINTIAISIMKNLCIFTLSLNRISIVTIEKRMTK